MICRDLRENIDQLAGEVGVVADGEDRIRKGLVALGAEVAHARIAWPWVVGSEPLRQLGSKGWGRAMFALKRSRQLEVRECLCGWERKEQEG